jgi:DNA-3-methyladenine glycosylase
MGAARADEDRAAPLPRSFYEVPTRRLARALIGAFLVHDGPGGRTVGRIVETEAYLGARDEAAHSFRGETARNRSMFGPPGHLYVYAIYGLHHCCNVVSGRVGVGEAVLLRALEPVLGIERMRARRGHDDVRALCSGPGKLVQAMGLERAHDGADLGRPPVWLAARGAFGERRAAPRIAAGPRIGISRAVDLPLRFWERESRFVSR